MMKYNAYYGWKHNSYVQKAADTLLIYIT